MGNRSHLFKRYTKAGPVRTTLADGTVVETARYSPRELARIQREGEGIARAATTSNRKVIRAKYKTDCTICRLPIQAGDPMSWAPSDPRHPFCYPAKTTSTRKER